MLDSPTKDDHGPNEAEHLLSQDEDSMEMADVSPESSRNKNAIQVETSYTDDPGQAGSSGLEPVRTAESTAPINGERQTIFKVYKMRWFGLGQLVLLNIVVSWDVSCPCQ